MQNSRSKKKVEEILKNFLNVYWLRPESALWRTIDVLAMDSFTFESPSLDLGCGDGIFSFIRAGGEFGFGFDMFQSVSSLDKYFENVDIYNYFDEKKIHPVIRKSPNYIIDVALDHKEALLKKAAIIGLYRKMVCWDVNLGLPFEDGSFKTIFSNIIYWLKKPQDVFKEVARILASNGKAVVMLPNSTMKDYSFYYRLFVKTGDYAWKWLEKIDRGRLSDNIKHTNDDEAWRRIFSKAGLQVVKHTQHLSKTVIETWDIGLRPIFPLLHKMASRIDAEKLIEIKKEWIALFSELLLPLCTTSWCTDSEYPPAFHCYVLLKI